MKKEADQAEFNASKIDNFVKRLGGIKSRKGELPNHLIFFLTQVSGIISSGIFFLAQNDKSLKRSGRNDFYHSYIFSLHLHLPYKKR